MGGVYYNEFDPFAAAWLRELIKAGQIPEGDVDERDMREVQPDDLRGYTQCHFFAGIGGWAYALRLAGWPDDRPVWTGSPPCQPFSTAGKGLGKADDRHLAPHFLELVTAIRPPVLFGEQVAAAVTKDAWLDDLLDALEGAGYATGAAVAPACSVGAPHIRQRLWFVAERLGDSSSQGLPERISNGGFQQEAMGAHEGKAVECGSNASGMADTKHDGSYCTSTESCLEETSEQCEERANLSSKPTRGCACSVPGNLYARVGDTNRTPDPNTTDSPWRDPDWLLCRDGKWRPTQSEIFPLADGIPNRVGILRGAGNAIVPQVAGEVIQAYMENSK